MKKFNDNQYEEYWKKTHAAGKEDLCCVCFPDKPMYFNLFFDRIQKRILKKYLKKNNIQFDGKTLLDIGCGRGRWLQFFSRGGKNDRDRSLRDCGGKLQKKKSGGICRKYCRYEYV